MIDHLNLSVNDLEETRNWYGKAFGFKKVEQGSWGEIDWEILKKGESMLCIYERPGKRQPSQKEEEQFHHIRHFGIRFESVKKWESVMNELKIQPYYPSPQRYPHSTSWYIKDPSGYRIEVSIWDQKKAQF